MASTEPESSTLSAVESELSTMPPSVEEQSTRLTSSQLASSSVIQRTRTSFVWKHMPRPINSIYTRGQHVYTVPRSTGSRVEQGISPCILKLLMIFTIQSNSKKPALSN